MYKTILLLLLLVFTTTAQEKNKITLDIKTGKPMLIGLCDRTAFVDTNFAWWYNSGYKFYRPEASVIEKLELVEKEYTITIVMGTWCSDSRREIPRFYKILDELKCPKENILLINVDREKAGANIVDLNIELVPTFIVYSDGKEIGRIVETPEISLEGDLLKILNKE